MNSDFTIESLSIFNLYIDSINLKDDDGEITCQPTAGLNANSAYSEPLEYIAVGQGFFISGDQDGGPIVFNNSQRENIVEGAQSTFFKSNIKHKKKVTATRKQLPILKLGMNYTGQTGTELHRQIGISFKYNNSFKSCTRLARTSELKGKSSCTNCSSASTILNINGTTP